MTDDPHGWAPADLDAFFRHGRFKPQPPAVAPPEPDGTPVAAPGLSRDNMDEAVARLYRPDPVLVRRVARSAGERFAAMLTESGATGEIAVLAELVEESVRRAFGCTCRDHSDARAVYVEDLTCPIHGSISKR